MLKNSAEESTGLPVLSYDASTDKFAYAFDDIRTAFLRPRLLFNLVKGSFFSKYQGTVFGGLWLTFTTLMMVTGLALLYSRIFGNDINDYFPYVAIGIIIWGVMSALINEGASIFLAASVAFNNAPIPKSTFAFRLVGTTFLSFLFKVIIIFAVLIYFKVVPDFTAILLSILGFLLLSWTGFWFSLSVGTLGTRYRDIGQLTNAFLTFAFFITPVFWKSDRLGDYSFIVTYNPLYHYINVVRGPLLGHTDMGLSFIWVTATTSLMTVLGIIIFGLFAKRISYWS